MFLNLSLPFEFVGDLALESASDAIFRELLETEESFGRPCRGSNMALSFRCSVQQAKISCHENA